MIPDLPPYRYRCARCGVAKDPERKNNYCKPCANAKAKEWRESNPEKALANRRAHYVANRERLRKRQRELYEAHPERFRMYNRKGTARRYGLTLEEYEAILAKGCAICGRSKGMQLDHDHKNGKVRAALCVDCNRGLGGFRDDPALTRRAAEYLESWLRCHT